TYRPRSRAPSTTVASSVASPTIALPSTAAIVSSTPLLPMPIIAISSLLPQPSTVAPASDHHISFRCFLCYRLLQPHPGSLSLPHNLPSTYASPIHVALNLRGIHFCLFPALSLLSYATIVAPFSLLLQSPTALVCPSFAIVAALCQQGCNPTTPHPARVRKGRRRYSQASEPSAMSSLPLIHQQ
ncbi:hypothetical protein GW17_00055306, partial [Ensete ventricosum]